MHYWNDKLITHFSRFRKNVGKNCMNFHHKIRHQLIVSILYWSVYFKASRNFERMLSASDSKLWFQALHSQCFCYQLTLLFGLLSILLSVHESRPKDRNKHLKIGAALCWNVCINFKYSTTQYIVTREECFQDI